MTFEIKARIVRTYELTHTFDIEENISDQELVEILYKNDEWDEEQQFTSNIEITETVTVGEFCGNCAKEKAFLVAADKDTVPIVHLLNYYHPPTKCNQGGCGIEASISLSKQRIRKLKIFQD